MSETEGYTITRVVDAPRELVWQCWTRPEHFAVWFGGHDGVMTDMVVEPVVGGRWGGTMTVPGGHQIGWNGRFLEVDEPRRLVLAITDEPELREPFETYTVTLTETDGKTELVVTQSGGNLTVEQYEQAKAGTAGFLDVMGELLDSLQA
ncbi:MAG TPA: SRPBCC domain-containing protein [Mycobacteriales bacterium]|jgi:uncharacterized protein YndB with AHSA1/START domain|nr:SRPBCC domain-containing protein [Mycobacteriales bacterium]